jgi:protein gp37
VLAHWPQTTAPIFDSTLCRNIDRLAPWPRHQVPENVWIGKTCENQEHFNRRWRNLSAIPARIRFISYEPALSSLQFGEAHRHVRG